jgi:O-succinylbenzoic acid--CoA ligase
MNDRYIINNREYSKNELTTFVEFQLNQKKIADWERNFFEFILSWVSTDESIIIRTSGSTGYPKEIQFSKMQLIRSAERTLDYFKLKQGQNILLCLPVQYIAGMMMIVRAFVGNLNLITTSPKNLKIQNIIETIDFTAMVPLQIQKLLEENQDFNKIKKIIIGGTQLSSEIAKKFKKYFKGKAWETYGMTETITHVAVKELDIHSQSQPFQALPGITFSTDSRECLIIKDTLLHDAPIITNDRVDLISNSCFHLIGRLDYVINSGGIKVQPEEIETLLAQHIKGKFCISAFADEHFGEIVVLVLEKGSASEKLKIKIQAIPSYYRPKKLVELGKMPLTRTGKIDRLKIKSLLIGKTLINLTDTL